MTSGENSVNSISKAGRIARLCNQDDFRILEGEKDWLVEMLILVHASLRKGKHVADLPKIRLGD